jgi:predicted nucleotide-binding protein (sugar kinase/HSP70/actin superfamily)
MAKLKYNKKGRLLFTKEMKREYTLLFPMMAPIHFTILKNVFTHYGYHAELLTTQGPEIAQTGLKYVHNDTCYPAILVIGQLINALQSGRYDVNKTALMITQTGGGCRASNYIHLLRKALRKAGFEQVPVVSVNLSGMEKNSGFHITLPLIRRALAALVYGDALMLLHNQTAPYEVTAGESARLVERWTETLTRQLNAGKGCSTAQLSQNLADIIAQFAGVPVRRVPKVKVGVVGEIYVKYASLGNNNLEQFLATQDCEVNVPGMMAFMMFKIDNRLEDIKLYGGSRVKYHVVNLLMRYCTKMEGILIDAVKRYPQFTPPGSYQHTKSLVKGVIGYGDKMGEGWLLTAEMLELAEMGYENIVCTQPFGCLPNHICGKGMIRQIRSVNEKANIVAIDYDAGATRVNQENRIKLMLSVAREALQEQPEKAPAEQETAHRAEEELAGVS